MFGLISIIFVSVFIIVNRMFLSPFEMGILILLSMAILVIEMYMSMLVRAVKRWLE